MHRNVTSTALRAKRSEPDHRSLCAGIVLALASIGLCGCHFTVTVENKLTKGPAVGQLPVTVGIHYDESFDVDQHDDAELIAGGWTIPMGQCSKPILDTCFEGMFERAVRLDDWAPEQPVPSMLDGVIVLKVEQFIFDVYPFRATVTYQLAVHAPNGSHFILNAARGQGQSVLETGIWGVSDTRDASSAVEQAIRAAAAQVVLDFPHHAGVRRWLARRGVAGSIERQMFGATPVGTPSSQVMGQGIVVIPIPASRETEGYRSISGDAARHVEKKLRRTHSVFASEDLRNQLFPWFERSTMPSTDAEVAELLGIGVVQRRLQELRIGHLILICGSALDDDFEGPLVVGAGFGAAGALGVSGRDEEAEVSAVVWDVVSRQRVHMEASDSGQSTILGLIVPIPLLARTDAHAIDALAGQLLEHFSTDKLHSTSRSD